MRIVGGAIVTTALEDEGITLTFGIPGTHNIELYDALAESETVRPILVTDEQGASFMADAVWRSSGELACVNIVPGAGLTHAMSGIAEAYMDNVPMLVLGCGIRQDTGHAFQLHDVDQMAMVAPVTKGQFRPETGDELYGTVREACRLARSGAPGPVFVEVPADLYMLKQTVASGWRAGGEPPPRDAPALEAESVDRSVELLRGARRPLIYVGAGAARAGDHIVALAERLEAPVSTTFQGKGVFPEDHPLFLWPGFGRSAPPFVREIAAECDLTLAVGCRFSEVGTGSYGLEIPGPLIHVDIDPRVLGANYDAEVAVVADASEFVQAVLTRLAEAERPRDVGLRDRIRIGHSAVQEGWLSDIGGDLVTPAHLLGSLQDILGPKTVYTTDSGNGTFLAVEMLRLSEPGKYLAPIDFSCMGYSVPAAVGAKLARPDCPVVALAGDGAFLMTGLEVITAVQHGVGVIVMVLRDRELAQISQFQATALNRKVASTLSDYDLEALARGMGAHALSIRSDDQVREVIRSAHEIAEAGDPVVVDVAIDYSEKTYFTRGIVKTNLLRFPLRERVRLIARALTRKVTG
ncbi:MAG: biosynthetic-type acetolactate synthase large subunit [Gemmatimonadota bacterium]|nr:MAG: biosynthetic-type acetolactate synthase large subunit [Gemmatimonadota bacterium]